MKNSLIDTHTHLCDPGFEADLDAVLARTRSAGIDAAVLVAETLADAEKIPGTGRKVVRDGNRCNHIGSEHTDAHGCAAFRTVYPTRPLIPAAHPPETPLAKEGI